MPRLLEPPSTAVGSKVLPVDGIPRQRPKDHTLRRGFYSFGRAVDEGTPPWIRLDVQQWKLGSSSTQSSLAIIHPDHKGAHSAPSCMGPAPVKMVIVMAAGLVALHTESLQPDLVSPSLEGAGPVLDTLYPAGAWNNGYFRVSDCGIMVN